MPLPCAIWPAKGLDLGLLDPASALQKIPSSAAHALKLSGYLTLDVGGQLVLNRQRRALNRQFVRRMQHLPRYAVHVRSLQRALGITHVYFWAGEEAEKQVRKVQGDCRRQRDARCERLLVLCTVNNFGKRLLRNGRRATAQSSAGRTECPLSTLGMALMICYCIECKLHVL